MVCVAPGQDPPVSIAVSWLFGGIVLVRFHSRYGFRYLSLARYMSDWLIRQIKLSWLVNGNSNDSESQVKMTTVYDSSFGPLKDHFFSLSLIVTINQSKKKSQNEQAVHIGMRPPSVSIFAWLRALITRELSFYLDLNTMIVQTLIYIFTFYFLSLLMKAPKMILLKILRRTLYPIFCAKILIEWKTDLIFLTIVRNSFA